MLWLIIAEFMHHGLVRVFAMN